VVIIDDDRIVQCDFCLKNTHLSCTGVDPDLDNDVKSGIIYAIQTIGLKCHVCRKATSDTDKALHETIRLQGIQLNKLNAALDGLKSKSSNIDWIHSDRSVGDAVFVRVVREVHDKDLRRRNLIVSGLHETGSSASDTSLFTGLCKDYLNFDLECDVSKTRRIEFRGEHGANP